MVEIDEAPGVDARFSLTPGLNSSRLDAAIAAELLSLPGIMTPSELQQGLGYDFDLFKLFPVIPAGNLPLLQTQYNPFALRASRFIPIGGITKATLADWLREPAVPVVRGTWITRRSAIRDRDRSGIRRSSRSTVRIRRDVRGLAA